MKINNLNPLKTFCVLTACYIFLGATLISSLTGKVVRVADGDTITVLTSDRSEFKIRLDGIDCPEKSQAFGSNAKMFTSDRCFGKTVRVEYSSTDRYGRYLGFVILPDGSNLNKELLRAGLAWHYKQYNNSEELATIEKNARIARIGLWSAPDPMAPWEYRKMKRSN